MRLGSLTLAALLAASGIAVTAVHACDCSTQTEEAPVAAEAPAEPVLAGEDISADSAEAVANLEEPTEAPAPAPPEVRTPLILDFADVTRPAPAHPRAAGADAQKGKGGSTAKSPLRFGTLSNDVLSITAASSDVGALQLVGVGPSVKLKLGVRWAAPAVEAGTNVKVLPWLGASYQANALADAVKAPTLLAESLDVSGGMNLFSGKLIAASVSADWQQRPEGGSAMSGLGRLRIGF